jgi:putative SOS response-associated peptidase YedK
MCGRVTLTLDKQTVLDMLGDVFQVTNPIALNPLPNYNIGPAQPLLSIIRHQGNNRAGYFHWGFIPPWATDEKIGYTLINTRCEGIESKKTFKSSFEHKRCLILADSFFEWKKEGTKTPYRFVLKDHDLMTFPGLYSTYTRPSGEKIHTCSIITCDANEIMKPIHPRMPVILNPTTSSIWLNEATHQDELIALLKPIDDHLIQCYEVSSYVNTLKNNSIKCIQPIPTQLNL